MQRQLTQVAGLLPPPLTSNSAELARDPEYEHHIARLNQLALLSNVYLKVLPPVILEDDSGEWTKDAKELQRVLRMYRKFLNMPFEVGWCPISQTSRNELASMVLIIQSRPP